MKDGIIFLCSTLSVLYLIGFFLILFLKFKKIEKFGIGTIGEVTRFVIKRTSRDSKLYYPVVKFKTLIGEELNLTSQYSFDHKQFINQGKTINLKYLPENPSIFILDDVNPRKKLIILLGICLTMYVGSCYILFSNFQNFLMKMNLVFDKINSLI